MDEGEIENSANSEIRFISLELMKLAQKSGKSFDEVAEEYISNTVKLQLLISGLDRGKAAKGRLHTRQK